MGTLTGAAAEDRAEPLEDASGRTAGTAVWVDGTSAIVVRWAGRPLVARVHDDVPPHHRSTGHVRHDPRVRHGGGGTVAEQLDRDRRKHRAAHLRRVERLLPETGPVLVLGPGSARVELERSVAATDRRHHRERTVHSEAAMPLTDREIVARLREWIGEAPRRRSIGRG